MDRKMLSPIGLALMLVLGSVIMAACGATAPKVPQVIEREPLKIAFRGDAATLDPHMRAEASTVNIQRHIYEPLIEFDAEGNLIPVLATAWNSVDDTTWRFTLRKGVRFHNGQPFNAQAVKFSIERAKTHPNSQFKAYVADVKEVKVVNEHTVDIITQAPNPILPNNLRNIRMVEPGYVQQVGDETMATRPVGTGPYKLVEWKRDDYLALEANPDWWGPKLEVTKVIFKPIPEDATRVAALISGEIDIAEAVPVADLKRIEDNPATRVERAPSLRVIYLGFDVKRKTGGPHPEGSPGIPAGRPNPFTDLRVRQAVHHAINIDDIVKFVMHGSAYPAAQFAPSGVFGHVEGMERLPYDPNRARRLLEEAGFGDGFKVRLDTPNDRYINDAKIGEAIVGQLAKVGIEVELNAIPKARYFPLVNGRDTTFFLLGWACGSQDMSSVLNACIHTTDNERGYGRFNDGEYSNPEVDALIEQANVTLDPSQRKQLLQEAVRKAMADVPWVPLHYEELLYGVSEKIEWRARSDELVLAYEIKYRGQ